MADDLRDPDDEVEDVQIEDEGEDAGLVDDQGGDEAEAGQEPEGAEAEERQVERRPGRGERAVLEAKRIAREAQEEKEALRRELETLRAERERERAQRQVETPEQEATRLSLMTAEERIDYKLQKAQRESEKAQRENDRKLAEMQFFAADAADKAAFEAKAAYDPFYKKYGPDVERLLAEERRKGMHYPRETVLDFVVGRRMRQQHAATAEKQRRQGQQRIARQRTQAGGDRSDRAAPRGRAGTGDTLADLERRLEGVEL